MITNVYSIYDVKSETYAPPFLAPTDGVAIRDCKMKALPSIKEFADDYRLFKIGTMNLSTADLVPLDNPKHIIDLVSLSE